MRKKQSRTLAIILLLAMIAAACWGASRAIADAMPKEEAQETVYGLPWATVNARNVNFREGPGKEYRVVMQWSWGVGVEVLRQQGGWCQVLHWTYPEPLWVWGEYLDFAKE